MWNYNIIEHQKLNKICNTILFSDFWDNVKFNGGQFIDVDEIRILDIKEIIFKQSLLINYQIMYYHQIKNSIILV